MPRTAPPVDLSDSDRQVIQRWLAAHRTPQQVALRCRIVVAAAEGFSDSDIAHKLDINRKSAILWHRRFLLKGLDCLWEVAAGRGRNHTHGSDMIQQVIDATLHTKPKAVTQ